MTTQPTQTDPPPHARTEPDPIEGILTVGALRDLLDQLTEQGISQDTAVVVYNGGWYDELSAVVGDPTDPTQSLIWLTLSPAGPADARFTSGHHADDDEPAVEPERLPAPVDVVRDALSAFWNDDAGSYKAGEFDAVSHAAKALKAAGYDRPPEAFVRQAADVAYVLGQLGADQTTDRSFHAAVASILTGGEDVFEGGRA